MFLVQLLLPVHDKQGRPIEPGRFTQVRQDLTHRFGGVTAYLRAPAKGLWKRSDDTVEGDDVVMVEVEVEVLEREWWHSYRDGLEQRFEQESILLRAIKLEPF